ncbi:hypothetical protein ACWENS_05605 [Streptomyces sp. NPDC004532]
MPLYENTETGERERTYVDSPEDVRLAKSDAWTLVDETAPPAPDPEPEQPAEPVDNSVPVEVTVPADEPDDEHDQAEPEQPVQGA